MPILPVPTGIKSKKRMNPPIHLIHLVLEKTSCLSYNSCISGDKVGLHATPTPRRKKRKDQGKIGT